MFYDIFRCCFFSAEDGLLAFCLSLCGAPGSRAQGVLVLVPCWGVAECGVFARRGGDIHRSVSLEHSFFFFLASRLKTVFTRFFTSYRYTQSQVGSLFKKGDDTMSRTRKHIVWLEFRITPQGKLLCPPYVIRTYVTKQDN